MKIQSLAVMFIILILPISLVLSSYTQSRVETLQIQASYDSKLNDSTYDALKAYQLNSLNNDTSDYTNSKIRDIKASVNTFFNSMSTNFKTLGYTKETLQNYIPALVYTMYDGYYIYSPYVNIWDNEIIEKHGEDTSYHGTLTSSENKEKLYGLKPYVYYSCRYKKSNLDVTVTYSLDNYVQIQGYVDVNGQKKTVSKYGYLLSDVNVNDDNITYKGVPIDTETLTENVYVDGQYKENLPYIKRNGTKYYTDGEKVFSVLNEKSVVQQTDISIEEIRNNNNAKEYYKEAKELQNFIQKYLSDITTNDIVNVETGNKYTDSNQNPYYPIQGKIFDYDYKDGIEADSSNFNTHRIDVIKNSIERNLSIAIANFNNYSNISTDFQLPELKDTDWDKIMDNISIISFMQGINIGGKVYNGYSIITNTINEDIVMEDSIYIEDKNTSTVHRITEENLNLNNAIGIYNINLERRSAEDTNNNKVYYFPIYATLSYDSIVTQNKIAQKTDQTLQNYISNLNNTSLKKVYYTALARERYGLSRQKLVISNFE